MRNKLSVNSRFRSLMCLTFFDYPSIDFIFVIILTPRKIFPSTPRNGLLSPSFFITQKDWLKFTLRTFIRSLLKDEWVYREKINEKIIEKNKSSKGHISLNEIRSKLTLENWVCLVFQSNLQNYPCIFTLIVIALYITR